MTEHRDIPAESRDLHPNTTGSIPMFSYDRVAWIVLQAMFEGMQNGGATDEQTIEFLQSKEMRWALDGRMGDELRQLGRSWGLVYAASAKEMK